MDRRDLPPLRSLPRTFLPGYMPDGEPIELPETELRKLRNVLRLSTGAYVAILPGDGTLIVGQIDGKLIQIIETVSAPAKPGVRVHLMLGLPRSEKLEEIVRMTTELGVEEFTIFPCDRTIVRWDEKKRTDRTVRLNSIAREASEVSYRGTLPKLAWEADLASALKVHPEAIVLSETENLCHTLASRLEGLSQVTLVVGPEGGWSPREVDLIGERATTMGEFVFRVETAAVAAVAATLLRG